MAVPDVRALALPVSIALAVVLGGASGAGALPNLLLQLLGVGAMWWAAVTAGDRPAERAERLLLAIGIAFLAVVCVQLVPLPPALWQALPGRAPVANEFRWLGAPLPYLAMSLAPASSLASVLALCVAGGMFAVTRRASQGAMSVLAWAIVAMAAISVLMGLVQLVSGQHSPLYLYTNTNRDQAVGFFANSNHLATLELMALPMVAALVTRRRGGEDEGGGQAGNLVALGSVGVLILLGIVTNGSLAGLILLLPTMIGCLLLFRGGRSRRIALIGFGVAILLVAIFVLLALNSPLISGYAATSLEAAPTSRLGFFRTTLSAIWAYFPVGSGLATFTTVYPGFENPATVSEVFINHAHNDYLEFILELGVAGVLLLLAFLAWWAWRVVAIWRDRGSGVLARAATISTAVVMAHSLGDYPIRTAAITAIFAACCSIMARSNRPPPPALVIDKEAPAARHLSA